MKKSLNVVFSIFFGLLIIGAAVRFTVGFKELYYIDTDRLNLESSTGYTKEEMKLNYDYLIDYNLGKVDGKFEMPTIPSSTNGAIHFQEVRAIIQNVIKIFYFCIAVSMIGFVFSVKNRSIDVLKYTSRALIIIPITLAIPMIIDFDRSFILFHEMLFDNNYWIFDPLMDPVINILPETFFFHAGIMILGIILIISICLNVAYKLLKSNKYFIDNIK